MAALLIVSLAVPGAFIDSGLEFAIAYGVVRGIAHRTFLSRQPRGRSAAPLDAGLGAGTALGVALLIIGSSFDPGAQAAIWTVALLLDMAEPFFFGSEGWKLSPGHFAERHWLIIIVALGESIVALGVGSQVGLTLGVITAAVLGMALVCAMWWIYFDVVAILGAQRLARASDGSERNELARDVYSYLHFPMVAGIVVAAFSLHEISLTSTIRSTSSLPSPCSAASRSICSATSPCGCATWDPGTASAWRLRWSCVALFPLALELDALMTLAMTTACSRR